ncbi:MAG TPA: Omp28-related outer membrane protein [Phaeodactylibacter sp.]|nr:Omp28-related outer membrane protein [Phaeodactylibacter sp.]
MKIKNLFLPIFFSTVLLILFFSSCKKDADPLADLPEKFTKKVLIEEFTGEWCPACSGAFPRIQDVLDDHPNTVFAAALHINDPFKADGNYEIKTTFSVSSFPSCMVDRFSFGESSPRTYPSTSIMTNRSNLRLEEKVNTGLKIETEIASDKANIKVFVGQNKIISGDPRLTVYLIEDEVPQVNQAGTSDPNYKHHAVVRQILTEAKGSPINLKSQERDFHTYSYEGVDISNFNKNHLKVIAFVHYFDQSDLSNHEIINVQQVTLGKNKDWD